MAWINLPFYSTKAMSSITLMVKCISRSGSCTSKLVKENEGVIYIDDFEGTRAAIDLRFPLISWTMASTPQKSHDQMEISYSPKQNLIIILHYGYNRAKIAWYNIEPVLQE